MRTMSRASGADAYAQSFGTGARSCLRSSSVKGEVVAALIRAGALLAQLHQHVVEQRRRTDAVEVGGQPVHAERLVQLDEVLDSLLRLPNPTCGFHSDHATGFLVHVANRLEHAKGDGKRRRPGQLAGRRLDEIGAGGDREQRRAADVVVGSELGYLEDDLEVRVAAGLLD